jgi:hypothetical protein
MWGRAVKYCSKGMVSGFIKRSNGRRVSACLDTASGVGMRFGYFFFGIVVVLFATSAAAGQERVFVIHSYHEGMPWTTQCNQGLEAVFPDDMEVEYCYLDTKRIPEGRFARMAEAAMERVRTFRPDLIMLGDDNALALLWKPLSDYGTPVVFFGINKNLRQYFKELPANMTGILERLPLFPWIRYLKEVMPEAAKALVLMDSSRTAMAIRDATFGGRINVSVEGVHVDYMIAADWDVWKEAMLGATEYDFILMPVFHAFRDSRGEHVSVGRVVRWASENSPVPVFASQDYAVGDDGVVGAYVISGEEHGRMAAELALGILDLKSPRLPLVNGSQKGQFVFNRRQLQRFGLVLPLEIEKRTIYRSSIGQ